MTKMLTTEPVPFDPWPTASPPDGNRSAVPEPLRAPVEWHRLAPAARGIIGGSAMRLLAEHPTAGRGESAWVANRLWEKVRGLTFTDGAREVPVERGITQHGLSPTVFLQDVILRLLALGPIEEALRYQRDSIDAQLAVLARMRQAPTA